ncbi:MAG: hypothetical protein H6732_13250 [Alphaproteobacteria bacterium]|nr:hypothetical protein [Alphaproteobacteria bacterium]
MGFESDYVVVATDAVAAERVTAALPPVGVVKGLRGFTTTVRDEDGRLVRRDPEREPDVSRYDRLRTLSGIQYYFMHNVKLFRGHLYYLDAEWSLTSVGQQQFWTCRPYLLQDGFAGVLSVDVGDWQVRSSSPLLEGSVAWDVPERVLAVEVFRQLHLDLTGFEPDDPQPYSHPRPPLPSWYHIDRFIEYGWREDLGRVGVVANLAPYLVPLKGDWRLRPGPDPWDPGGPQDADLPPRLRDRRRRKQRLVSLGEEALELGMSIQEVRSLRRGARARDLGITEEELIARRRARQHGDGRRRMGRRFWQASHGGYPVHFGSLVFAGTYLKHFTRMTTMECANESARHAVNAILDHWLVHHTSDPPAEPREEPSETAPPPVEKPAADSVHPEVFANLNTVFEGDEAEPIYFPTPVGDYCQIWNPEENEPEYMAGIRAIDEQLCAWGMPHLFDLMGIELGTMLFSHTPFANALPAVADDPVRPLEEAIKGLLGSSLNPLRSQLTRSQFQQLQEGIDRFFATLHPETAGGREPPRAYGQRRGDVDGLRRRKSPLDGLPRGEMGPADTDSRYPDAFVDLDQELDDMGVPVGMEDEDDGDGRARR